MRAWTLVVADPGGRARRAETFVLADSEDEFWAAASHSRRTAASLEADFISFLERAIAQEAPLWSPQDLAWVLAAHARTALDRIELAAVPALDPLKAALSESLGLTFDDEDGEHFFRSTLVQTLFYGIFSAWVLWHLGGARPDERFRWHEASWHLRVPMVSVLFEKIATPSTLRPLGVEDVMAWTEDVLARVDRQRFFHRFEEGKAVQYFYEPFLEHFDSRLREQFGVWYTPREVVDYMVEQIDQALREDLGIELGFADERVVVLDPCVGTGSFILAVLEKLHSSLPKDALAAHDVKRAAMGRIFGFEILPAPFVVAHLQLGQFLSQLGAPLDADGGERAAVYLTNALTGWGAEDVPSPLPFPELDEEREAAHGVKQAAQILVVLGNPPYYPFAGVNSAEEADLIAPYKQGITTRNSLNDLYVRFIRVAERRIVEGVGHGVVCFITSFSYLHEPGFVQMRRTLLDEFDVITIDNLNGDSRQTGKRTPDGLPDPSIFSTPYNRQGIQVGTAVGTFVRKPSQGAHHAEVRYRDFWGEGKLAELMHLALTGEPGEPYSPVELTALNHLAFRPSTFGAGYGEWPSIVDLAGSEPLLGLNENRGGALIDADKDALVGRMRTYLDPDLSFEDLKTTSAEPLTQQRARFDPATCRERLLARGFAPANVRRFVQRPLDIKWAYVETDGKLWNEARSSGLMLQSEEQNEYLLVRRRASRTDDGAALLPASCLGDQHALHSDAYYIPHWVSAPEAASGGLFHGAERQMNISPTASAYLRDIGIDPASIESASILWHHALAVAYTPQYLQDNADGIASDWPRVPLPAGVEVLRTSAALGRTLAVLLDPLQQLPAGLPRIGQLQRTDGEAADPARGDLDVTAGWGHVQVSGAVMPGQGKLQKRPFTETEVAMLGGGDVATALGQGCDVFLNDRTYWAGVPLAAWTFKIGGFQVLKKWLSYREYGGDAGGLLGRGLTVDEVREFTQMAQRLTAVVLLQPALDESYARVLPDVWRWTTPATTTTA